jgi:hypothetical protein
MDGKASFRGDIVDQSIDFGISQLLAEGGHEGAAKLNPDHYILPAWLSMTERQSLILKQMIQAGAEFSGVFLIFVNVVAHCAILAEQIAPVNQRRFFPGRRLDFGSA